jgi:hypothetical protein
VAVTCREALPGAGQSALAWLLPGLSSAHAIISKAREMVATNKATTLIFLFRALPLRFRMAALVKSV